MSQKCKNKNEKKNEQEMKNKLEKEASKKHNYANMTRKEKSYCTHTQGQHTLTHTHARLVFVSCRLI